MHAGLERFHRRRAQLAPAAGAGDQIYPPDRGADRLSRRLGVDQPGAVSGVTGIALTKLDVLDGLDVIRIAVGYRCGGSVSPEPPSSGEGYAELEPVYEELPGWRESTVGVTSYAALPAEARGYLERLQELVSLPIDMISTGPEREQTIVLRHPFEG